MALHGKFVINDAYYSPLSFPGIGTFLAFSGNGAYRNRGACGMIPKEGPVPAGKYWIVDRPQGGLKSQLNTVGRDIYNHFANGATFKHSEWFALWRDDWGSTITHGLRAFSVAISVCTQAYYQKVVSLSHMILILPCCVMLC